MKIDQDQPIITVVIPTWRRPRILSQVLLALSKQTLPLRNFEIIVADSNSNDETEGVVFKAQKDLALDIKFVHSTVNSLTAKRNLGISLARGDFIVFLDDDCIPEYNHLDAFLRKAESRRGRRVAWCGGVNFKRELVRKSNYYRYRDSCHFSSYKKQPPALTFRTVVAMNMLIERKLLIADQIRFDERFIGYGFEDLHFGVLLESKGFQILTCDADILHDEPQGDIINFRKKFFHAARDGMPVFRNVAPDSIAHVGLTAWLEPFPQEENLARRIIRSAIHLALDSGVPRVVAALLDYFDERPFFYSKSVYRFVLAGAYRDGVRARSSRRAMTAERANKDGWY